MPLTVKYDKILDEIREDDAGTVLYITNGSNGITTIRMEDSGGTVWDFTVTTDGHWLSTLIGTSGNFLLETGDSILLETGDKLVLE